MTPSGYRLLKRVLQEALVRDPAERPAFLDETCAGDADLRRDVESLLAHHAHAGGLLGMPVDEGAEQGPLPVDVAALGTASTLDATSAAHAAGATVGAGHAGHGDARGDPRAGLPRLDRASVLLRLGPGVAPGAGVRLADLRDDPPIPPLTASAEKYEVLGVLGEGGMGRVYLAFDKDLGRTVALKMLRAGSASLAARFLEEAQVMGQLQHPGIVPVFELGIAPGERLYYTMPVVRGQTVSDLLFGLRQGDAALRKRYSLTRLVQVFLQVVQAVGYAHERGVVHRDLKPANVMVGEHGEVQVLDWGLSKILGGSDLKRQSGEPHTRGRIVVGTPDFMSPEQVRGETVDARSDVYALGVILYEVLTLERLFEGDESSVLAAHLAAEPEPPHVRAPERRIPSELERACLRALRKRPADRHGSASELYEEIECWLEAESDRMRRHELAEARAAAGSALLAELGRRKTEIGRLEHEAEAAATRFESYDPVEQKAERFAAEDRVERARDALVRVESQVVFALREALGFEEQNRRARSLLADYYWGRFVEAEQAEDARTRDFYGEFVAKHDDGRYAQALRGDGSLALESEPPGAEIVLHRLEERLCRLEPCDERQLGVTPLPPTPLAMGSYLAVLRLEGHADVRYPVLVARSRACAGRVRLYRPEDIPAGFVHVPAGTFVEGGDRHARHVVPRRETWVDDVFVSVFPVTMEEYLVFLADLARDEGMAAARARAPRPATDAPTYLRDDGRGGLTLPGVDPHGDRWHLRMPVFGVSWLDAQAYIAWRSLRDGRRYRLPEAAEWEKAARGVDGRAYPWGNRFDPSLCNVRESRRERPAPVAVEEFASDVSIYGVRGMAGNVDDWTSTEIVEGSGETARFGRAVRGGGWRSTRVSARVTHRSFYAELSAFDDLGFRLVADP